jgi:hypothetical protein
MKQNAAGKQFKFRVLATMASSQSSSITQAITKLASAETIDDKATVLTFSRGSAYTLGTSPLVGREDWDTSAATPKLNAGSAPAIDADLHSFQVSQTLSLASTATSVVTIQLPLTHTNPGADY